MEMEIHLIGHFYLQLLLFSSLQAQDNEPPRMVPRDEVVYLNDDVEFECYSDTPPKWSKYKSLDGFEPSILTEYNGVYERIVVRNVQFNDRGTYSCEGEDKGEKFLAHSNLYLGVRHNAIQQASPYEVDVNSIMHLLCSSEGGRPRWFYRRLGKPGVFPMSEGYSFNYFGTPQFSSGYYYCYGNFKNGETFVDEIYVIVTDNFGLLGTDAAQLPKPSHHILPTVDSRLHFGFSRHHVKLKCKSEIEPIWKNDKNKVFPYEVVEPYNGEQMTIAVRNLKIEETGYYYCYGQQNNKEIKISHFILVGDEKSIIREFQAIRIGEGSPLTLQCDSPYGSERWYFEPITYYKDESYARQITSDPTFDIRQVQFSDTGTFWCFSKSIDEQAALDYVRVQVDPSNERYSTKKVLSDKKVSISSSDRIHDYSQEYNYDLQESPDHDREKTVTFATRDLIHTYYPDYEKESQELIKKKKKKSTFRKVKSYVRKRMHKGPKTLSLEVKVHPSSKLSVVGNSAIFRCSVNIPKPYELEWKFNDGSLPRNVRTDGNEIKIVGIRKENSGLYICVVKGDTQTDSSKGKLVVIRKPSCLRGQTDECEFPSFGHLFQYNKLLTIFLTITLILDYFSDYL